MLLSAIKKVTVSFLTVIILLFLVEAGVRGLFPNINTQGIPARMIDFFKYPVLFPVHHADTLSIAGWRPSKSGLIFGKKATINLSSFRQNRKSFTKGKKSILFLGDSVLFGVGVEDHQTFASILNDSLNHLQVINFSMPGYNLRDYYNLIPRLLVDEELDIQSVFLFLSLNDLQWTEPYPVFDGRYPHNTTLSMLKSNLKSYILLKSLMFHQPKRHFLYDASFLEDTSRLSGAVRYLEGIKKQCINREVPLVLYCLPSQYALEMNINTTTWKKLPWKSISGSILDFDNKQHVASMYLFGDGIHLSPIGHLSISNSIIQNMKKSGLFYTSSEL